MASPGWPRRSPDPSAPFDAVLRVNGGSPDRGPSAVPAGRSRRRVHPRRTHAHRRPRGTGVARRGRAEVPEPGRASTPRSSTPTTARSRTTSARRSRRSWASRPPSTWPTPTRGCGWSIPTTGQRSRPRATRSSPATAATSPTTAWSGRTGASCGSATGPSRIGTMRAASSGSKASCSTSPSSRTPRRGSRTWRSTTDSPASRTASSSRRRSSWRWSEGGATARSWPCSSWISTTSNGSTIRSDTTRATSSSSRWRSACGIPRAAPTWSLGRGATSSSSCSRTSRRRPRRRR